MGKPQSARALLEAIDVAGTATPEERRPYLGGSMIGDACTRRLWYWFRGFGDDDFSARTRRIFKTGHAVEDIVLAALRAVPGFQVLDRVFPTKRQFGARLHGGWVRGNFDGFVRSTGGHLPTQDWHLLEIKSMNRDRFAACKKHGVATSDPKYYSQIQFYLATDEAMARGCASALFVAMCKDTSEMLAEVVPFDLMHATLLHAAAKHIVETDTPPTRGAGTPRHPLCNGCVHKPYCWGAEPPPTRDCRQCAFAVADTVTGMWTCSNPQSPNAGHANPAMCGEFATFDLGPFPEPTDG